MPPLARDYFVMVFLASCGAIQVACAYARLYGLLFLRRPLPSALLGVALMVAGFLWFFAPGPHNIPDYAGGLDGNEQALLFSLASLLSLVLTLSLTSLVNRRGLPPAPAGRPEGLDALRHGTYFQLLQERLGAGWRRWSGRIPPSSSG